MNRSRARALPAVLAMVLAACSSQPPTPDWRMNAHGALERAVAAHLSGDTRVADLEFARARAEVARTGRVDLLARAELLRCAAQLASLVDEPCAGFEPLRADAPPAEQAYADFLRGTIDAARVPLLPPQQRAIAASNATLASDLTALQAMTDPLSRLVAAAVSLRHGRGNVTLLQVAVDTASDQGWRRPLLAWLGVQQKLALKAGDTALAERLGRRRQLVLDGPSTPP
jgi:hypothetical protein